MALNTPTVVSVSASAEHGFSKPQRTGIRLIAGLGVEGDAHAGATVQHLSRLRRDPSTPNLRQVHLLHAELFDEVQRAGFTVAPGELGENVTTTGIDLLALPRGARLHLGDDAIVEVTGLRNPCAQINDFRTGLLKEMVTTDGQGHVIRRAGVMGVVVAGGEVLPGDAVRVELPVEPHVALDVV